MNSVPFMAVEDEPRIIKLVKGKYWLFYQTFIIII